jgi:hypothetical protein
LSLEGFIDSFSCVFGFVGGFGSDRDECEEFGYTWGSFGESYPGPDFSVEFPGECHFLVWVHRVLFSFSRARILRCSPASTSLRI